MLDFAAPRGPTLTSKIAETDIAAYRRDGAVVLRNVLTPSDLVMLEQGIEEAYRAPTGRASHMQGSHGQGRTMVDQLPSLGSPSLRAFLDLGIAAQLAGRMMGVPTAHFVLDQLFYKERGRVLPTPWHQDTPFLRVRGDDMARVWLTCDPSPADLTIELVRGSHRWNVVYDTAMTAPSELQTVSEGQDFSYSGMGSSALPTVPDIARYRDSFEILRWDVSPGDALIFNGNMLHGASGCDNHPTPRRAYASMWGGPALRHHNPPGAKSMPSVVEMSGVQIPHGAPIGTFPEAFPIGWTSEH
ncbi:phytanoyl-CoA dioxygenase family protein [Novosphingobium sp. M1R2S20]|uniref:Phytanoyl-CoA dioxygenase family protein n=1 Tax=Novosphingobium rhizovicinum TaxID=3228928 RepID=A0ABV3RBF5_9SPHN